LALRNDESLCVETIASIILDITRLSCGKLSENEYRTLVDNYRTISRGNCKSMNNDIAGKIKSEVSGLEDMVAAVAKELNATSRGIPLHKAILED
jgi:hypothetical protein